MDKLSKAPPIQLIISSFMDWVGKSPLIAHNARYDMRMLQQELERLELSHLLEGKKVFCTMQYYRRLFPNAPYTLEDIASHYSQTLLHRTAHTALSDSDLLSQVFTSILGDTRSL
uniref:Exonuclease domain-containing protein n=1 Tax=Arcella intermedia TaxID=1963864 RepID=A0A6B2LLR3_9EUKA